MELTSIDNEHIKKYIKLKDKKYRDKYDEFIVEGSHLVLEAYKRGLIKELIIEKESVFPLDVKETFYIPHDIMKKISNVSSPQKVMALCHKKSEDERIGNRILLLDGVQDPGNLGTIIRSAVAFNIDTIILSDDTVDLYNPKVVRATQGMFFHVNIIRGDIKEKIEEIKEKLIPIYTTNVTRGHDVREISKKDKIKYALVVGNEGNGVRKEIEELCDKLLYIEMNELVESLNVGIATSILLYELGR